MKEKIRKEILIKIKVQEDILRKAVDTIIALEKTLEEFTNE